MISGLVRRLALSVPVLAVLLAGCGPASSANNAKSYTGPKKDVATAVDDFSKAVSSSDDKKICDSLLSRALVAKLNTGHTTCSSVLSDQLDAAGDSKLDIKAITLNGTTATASVVSKFNGHDRASTLTLVNEGGWKLSGCGGC